MSNQPFETEMIDNFKSKCTIKKYKIGHTVKKIVAIYNLEGYIYIY